MDDGTVCVLLCIQYKGDCRQSAQDVMNIPKSRLVRFVGWFFGIGHGFRTNRVVCNRLIYKASAILDTCRSEGVGSASSAINLSLYTAVLIRDINCMLARLWKLPESSERNLVCRHLSLAIVEGLEDLAELNGHCIRDMPENTPVRYGLKKASQEIAELRKQHEVSLRLLRVTASAHRDKNARVLLNSIHNVVPADVEMLGWTVYQTLTTVMTPLTNIVEAGCEVCKAPKLANKGTHPVDYK